jgi:hypothetical protein
MIGLPRVGCQPVIINAAGCCMFSIRYVINNLRPGGQIQNLVKGVPARTHARTHARTGNVVCAYIGKREVLAMGLSAYMSTRVVGSNPKKCLIKLRRCGRKFPASKRVCASSVRDVHGPMDQFRCFSPNEPRGRKKNYNDNGHLLV